MSTVLHRRQGRRILATALTVVGASLALLAPPAQAVPTGGVTGGTVSWGTSVYLASSNTGRPNPYPAGYAAPATYDSGISTWGAGTGLVAPNGSATLQFDGTSVNFAKTSGSWLKLKDLEATLDASGNGTVSALVSYGVAPGTYPPDIPYNDTDVKRGPTRVDLVVLSGNASADRTVTSTTAAWAGLDGAWAPAFLDFIDGDSTANPAVPAFPYYTQINSNADRTPLPFSFSVTTAVPAVSASVTDASYGDGVTVGVSGTGFRAVTTTGDAGVYAGLAPSGEMPDVSSQAGMAAFAAAQWIQPGQIVDGAFSTSLVASRTALDPTETYSVYTWQAHAHSNTSQDTETPVTIDWSALAPVASTTTPGGASTQAFGEPAVITAAVPGKGAVTLTGVGPAQTKTGTAGGVVSFTVPAALPVGGYTAAFAYAGGGSYTASQATKSFAVTVAEPGVSATWKKKPTSSKKGKLLVKVAGPAGVAQPAGEVTVKLKSGDKVKKVKGTLSGGQVTLKLPKLAAGTWKLTITYAGGGSYSKADTDKTVKVS